MPHASCTASKGINKINPIALRTAETLWSFGPCECNRIKLSCQFLLFLQGISYLFCQASHFNIVFITDLLVKQNLWLKIVKCWLLVKKYFYVIIGVSLKVNELIIGSNSCFHFASHLYGDLLLQKRICSLRSKFFYLYHNATLVAGPRSTIGRAPDS